MYFFHSGEVTGSTVGQVAIICRTNATVFDEAVKICRMNDDDIKVGFVGVSNTLFVDD